MTIDTAPSGTFLLYDFLGYTLIRRLHNLSTEITNLSTEITNLSTEIANLRTTIRRFCTLNHIVKKYRKVLSVVFDVFKHCSCWYFLVYFAVSKR